MTARDTATTQQEQGADLALRCAWLRAHAGEVAGLDRSGQLAAHLRDFADLLEVAQREGWWDR